MKKLWILPIALLALVALGTPASAGTFYVGASWLSTDAEFDTAVDNFDTDDSGWKVFAGYDFLRFLGVEASYRDLGTFDQTIGPNSISADLSVYDAEVRGFLPIGKALELFAKVGYGNISADITTSDGITTFSGDDTSGELLYGVGVAIKLGEGFAVRAEWEEWDVDTSLNGFSVGASFRFGSR
jgi:OmpA-OmpF porin, OOP family